jgi:excisionase family DNA binding protein
LQHLTQAGQVPCVRLGDGRRKIVLYPVDLLRAWLAHQAAPAAPPPPEAPAEPPEAPAEPPEAPPEHQRPDGEEDAVPRMALRLREAAQALGISPRTLWAWTRNGRMPCVRQIGGRRSVVLYPVRELLAWLSRQEAKGGNG